MCRMETSFIVTGKRRQDRSGAGHDRSLSFFEILSSHLGRFPRLMRFKETDAYLASSLQWLRHGSRVQRESTWNSLRNPRTKNAAGEIAESVTSHCDHGI